jgi:hypothetical protein
MSRNWRAKRNRAGSLGQASRMYPIRRADCVPDGVCARIPGAQGFGRHNPSIGGMLSLRIMKQNRKAGGNNVCVFTDEFGVKQTPCGGGGDCPCVQMIFVDNLPENPTLGPFSAGAGGSAATGEVISVLTGGGSTLLVTLDNCSPAVANTPIGGAGWTGTVSAVGPAIRTSPPCPCLQIFGIPQAGGAPPSTGVVEAPPGTVIGTIVDVISDKTGALILMRLPAGVPCESGSGVTTTTSSVNINLVPYNVFDPPNVPPPVQLQGSGGGSNGNAACCSCQGPKAYCPNCWERKTRFTLSTK